ncbi:hypothetical protein [Lactovum odontotermitis]
MKKVEKRIEDSIGYKNVMRALKEVFGDHFSVVEVLPTDDITSFDFRSNIDILGTSGIDISVDMSGNSHQFQIGAGVVSIAVPIANGFYNLPSGQHGEALEDILNDRSLKTEASADDLEQIKQICLVLEKYLEGK